MSIHIPGTDIVYFPVPKVACTSLKRLVYEIINDQAFEATRDSNIHIIFPSEPLTQPLEFDSGVTRRLAVVRDPVGRLISAYRNRVVFHRELERKGVQQRLSQIGLTSEPSITQFVANLKDYQWAAPSIYHHTRPIVDYLGNKADCFDHIFDLRQVAVCARLFNTAANTDVALEHTQRTGPVISADALDAPHLQLLRKYYAEDIEVYGHYWSVSVPLSS